MTEDEIKSLPVIMPFGIDSDIKEKITRIIEDIIDFTGQISLFPAEVEDLFVPIEQAKEVRENVLKLLDEQKFDIETENEIFKVVST